MTNEERRYFEWLENRSNPRVCECPGPNKDKICPCRMRGERWTGANQLTSLTSDESEEALHD